MELYWIGIGPPSRAAMMAIKYLGLDVKTHTVNPLKGETQKSEYLKVYPLHKVPYLVDGNFQLGESRAIMGYLADKYGKDDTLYPKDIEKRAKVNAVMFYEIETIYSGIQPLVMGKFSKGTLDPEKKAKVDAALQEFEAHVLGNKKFLTGDNVTIADIAALAGITFLELIQYDISQRKSLCEWIKRCKAFAWYKEANVAHEEMKSGK